MLGFINRNIRCKKQEVIVPFDSVLVKCAVLGSTCWEGCGESWRRSKGVR